MKAMGDYINREDAKKWLTNLRDDCGRYQDMWHYAEALEQIIKLLDTDVAPVVRCKDCVSWEAVDGDKYQICALTGKGKDADDFCSMGERQDDE